MNDDNAPIDRHDLTALKEWVRAEFKAVGATLEAMRQASLIAERERTKKDEELNNVRFRFVDRTTFETERDAHQKAFAEYKTDQEARRRSLNLTLTSFALTIAGLVIAVVNLAR